MGARIQGNIKAIGCPTAHVAFPLLLPPCKVQKVSVGPGNFLTCFEPMTLQVFGEGLVCMIGSQFQLGLSRHFYLHRLASYPEMRDEGFSDLSNAQSPGRGLLDSRVYVRAFQSPSVCLILQFFFQSFWFI